MESSGETRAAEGTVVVAADSDNPFRIPDDEELFEIRKKETESRRNLRDGRQGQKIWDRTTGSSTSATSRKGLGDFRKKLKESMAPPAKTESAAVSSAPRRERENMSEFISKKRDMFLLQMSLDTKREEIKKLDEKARLKEEALRKSEAMLQEDAMRFDAFLKENDKKAHDALKRADKESKLKQEKAAEIKKLNQEISKVESEMTKYEDRLSLCLKYKEFLERLTPPEFLKQREEKQAARAASTGGPSRAAASGPPQAVEAADREGAGAGGDLQLQLGGVGGSPGEGGAVVVAEEAGGGAEDMYFRDPAQLLEIFSQLEERNLFLIQNVQETEEALEELKQKYNDTKDQMEQKTSQLKDNIDDLQRKIKAENDKAESLTLRARTNTAIGDQNALLSKLAHKVREVYVRCGFDATEMDTLDMLREIEGSLEHLLVQVAQMPPDVLAAGEKEKETERRERVRVAKYEEQQRMYEERLRKSNARANAEVHKRTGKPVMFRSPPIRKKKSQKNPETLRNEEAEDVKKYFTP